MVQVWTLVSNPGVKGCIMVQFKKIYASDVRMWLSEYVCVISEEKPTDNQFIQVHLNSSNGPRMDLSPDLYQAQITTL